MASKKRRDTKRRAPIKGARRSVIAKRKKSKLPFKAIVRKVRAVQKPKKPRKVRTYKVVYEGKRIKVSRYVWEQFHPRYTKDDIRKLRKRGNYRHRAGEFKRRAPLKRFPKVGDKREANPYRSPLHKKPSVVALVSPGENTTLVFETATNLDWNSPRHTVEVISKMVQRNFERSRARVEKEGVLVLAWRGGFRFRISKRNTKRGKPIWDGPFADAIQNELLIERAEQKTKKKLEGLWHNSGMGQAESQSKYRVHILSVITWAVIAGRKEISGIKEVARNGKRRRKARYNR